QWPPNKNYAGSGNVRQQQFTTEAPEIQPYSRSPKISRNTVDDQHTRFSITLERLPDPKPSPAYDRRGETKSEFLNSGNLSVDNRSRLNANYDNTLIGNLPHFPELKSYSSTLAIASQTETQHNYSASISSTARASKGSLVNSHVSLSNTIDQATEGPTSSDPSSEPSIFDLTPTAGTVSATSPHGIITYSGGPNLARQSTMSEYMNGWSTRASIGSEPSLVNLTLHSGSETDVEQLKPPVDEIKPPNQSENKPSDLSKNTSETLNNFEKNTVTMVSEEPREGNRNVKFQFAGLTTIEEPKDVNRNQRFESKEKSSEYQFEKIPTDQNFYKISNTALQLPKRSIFVPNSDVSNSNSTVIRDPLNSVVSRPRNPDMKTKNFDVTRRQFGAPAPSIAQKPQEDQISSQPYSRIGGTQAPNTTQNPLQGVVNTSQPFQRMEFGVTGALQKTKNNFGNSQNSEKMGGALTGAQKYSESYSNSQGPSKIEGKGFKYFFKNQ
ncbi:hypothetical protein HK096_010679, partial [Nowakowskiella sp. JEL0078]